MYNRITGTMLTGSTLTDINSALAKLQRSSNELSSGRKILEAARVVSSHPNLHMVYITNFKCGPDSYIKHFAREAAGAPLLILQFDGHGNDAGYMTRCEAYLDSKGILRCYQPPKEPNPAPTLIH